jgi:cytochrome P450
MINLSFAALCRNPEQLDRLRADPGLIPGAVEELLRYVILNSTGMPRVTREEVCLGGATIQEGETVIPAFNMANRDPAAFEDPDRLDVGREPRSHLAFGAGAHHCVGAQLARIELQEAFRGLLAVPGLRMAVPASGLEFHAGQIITSMRELPVTWGDA